MVVFWLGNDNILAAYLCSTAGRGMHTDHEFASGSLKTHRHYLVFPEEVEKTCRVGPSLSLIILFRDFTE